MSGIHYLLMQEYAKGMGMSLREKFAWVALMALIAGVFGYITVVILGYQRVVGHHQLLWLVSALVAALVIVPPAIRWLLAMRMPRGALTEQDERERLFELKATRIAFFVLAITLMASSPFIVHARGGRLEVIHCLAFAIVLSYLVKFGVEIRYHRRGY
jgi:drug/metabolite transporter (DMT)-like permease